MPENKRHSLDAFVAETLGESEDEAVLGSFVVVAEIIHEDHVELRVVTSEGVSPWVAQGMLSTALEWTSLPPPDYDVFFEPDDDMGDPSP